MSALFHGILVGASGYALHHVTTAFPYAYTSFAFLMGHGLIGLSKSLQSSDAADKAYELTKLIVEIIPLPLVNVELYLRSSSRELAICHGLSAVIPVSFALVASDGGGGRSNQKLIDLTILGNTISLLFLAVNEKNYWFGGLALAAFVTKFATKNLDIDGGMDGNSNGVLLGNAIFSVVAVRALLGSF